MMGPMMLLLLEDWSAEEMGKARSPNSTSRPKATTRRRRSPGAATTVHRERSW
jgi:hypothetical protein